MPEIEWNKRIWDGEYNWEQAGDNWSSAWGSVDAQWYWSLLPRISRYLPAGTVLEIGPGYGRWSQFLAGNTSRLILVDISSECIAACKKRFAAHDHVEYYVNDGSSLAMIGERCIDVVFSFDSLVHAEIDVLDRYLQQLTSKMKTDGVIIVHHSNLGDFRYFSILRGIEKALKPEGSIYEKPLSEASRSGQSLLRRLLGIFSFIAMKLRIIDRTHMRAITVSASKFKETAEKHGYVCVSQEVIRWGSSRRPIDCISIVTPKDSKWVKRSKFLVNKAFMKEARYVRTLAKLYTD